MSNIFLAWQNRTDEGILSGGSWSASLPLTNMQNRQVQKVARTSSAARSATEFTIDLQQPRPIDVLALVVHNLSVSAKVRITAADSSSALTNLITTFASDLSNAVWDKGFATATQVSQTAPDGTGTVSQITNLLDNGGGFCLRPLTVSGTSTLTFSANLKAGTAANAELGIEWYNGGGYSLIRARVNLITGQVTTFAPSGAANFFSAEATSLGNGWWRFSVTGQGTDAANTSAALRIYNYGAINQTLLVYDTSAVVGNAPMYVSPWNDVWPSGVISQDLLEWEDDNFWLGTLSAEARAGFQSPYIHRLPEINVARYWKVEMIDASNPAGYVQIGRLFMARGWTPTINYTYGAGLGYQDPTPVETSLSGAEYFDIRSKFRVFNFKLDYINDTDAYLYALELQRLAGISGEVMVIPDGGENLAEQPLRSFVGRLRQIGAVTQPQPSAYSVNFEVKELL